MFKDGSTPLYDEAELSPYSEVTRDPLERRTAEESLRRAEEQAQQLLDAVTDCALFRLDVNGHVASWNSSAERIFGYQSDESIGRPFGLFFAKEATAAGEPEESLRQAAQNGRVEKPHWHIRKDGTRFSANVTLTAQHDAQGKLSGYACVTRDLTEQRRVEEVQRRLSLEKAARGAAEDVNRMKDEFLATACQELKVPLNAIVEWTSLLKAQPTSSVTAKTVDVIHQSAETQLKIIEDILSVSRIMTGKLKLELNLVDAAITLDSAFRFNRRRPSDI